MRLNLYVNLIFNFIADFSYVQEIESKINQSGLFKEIFSYVFLHDFAFDTLDENNFVRVYVMFRKLCVFFVK